ncbi:MAG: hypothetical protein GY715_06010 [Planctomycetes bacterium]|nr:hypothetical protein [Planctomycetota bacterium]
MDRTITITVATLVTAALGSVATAATIDVPTPQNPTIQSAIDDAVSGQDVVLVQPGVYAERINFLGKAIEVKSTNPTDPLVVAATIIDGTSLSGSLVRFETQETRDAIISGFTIRDGTASKGGAIKVDFRSDPTIRYCVFDSNSSFAVGEGGGGAICVLGDLTDSSDPLIEHCTFLNNHAVGGGGIYSEEAHPTIRFCNFENNTATGNGGGIYVRDEHGVLITSCDFTGNTASRGGGIYTWYADTQIAGCDFDGNNGGGAGVYARVCNPQISSCTFDTNHGGNGGAIAGDNSDATVSACEFTSNDATGMGSGGAVYLDSGSDMQFTDCVFTSNQTTGNGGAVYHEDSHATFTRCTFSQNQSHGFGGGAVYDIKAGPAPTHLTLVDCLFYLNKARDNGKGGGMVVYGGATAELTDCEFIDNRAFDDGDGGGLFTESGTSATLINTIFRDNRARRGGGLCTDDGTITLRNCTVGTNHATDTGGAIYVFDGPGSVTATNSILCANTPNQVVDISGSSTISFSDVQGGWGGSGSSNINQDPRFNNEAAGDLRLDRFSPCVDAGDNAEVPGGITLDRDGNPRFVNDAGVTDTGSGTPPIVDMGAYERQDESVNIGFTVSPGGLIQDAIDDALDGDWVDVEPGTYFEAIDLLGKAIEVTSTGGRAVTTIDGTGLFMSVVTFDDFEGTDTVLEGFTITGGDAPQGGGIYVWDSSPTIRQCAITLNTALDGGGIYTTQGHPVIQGCVVSGNTAALGAGLALDGEVTISGTSFETNQAGEDGGGMYVFPSSTMTLSNCIFDGNVAGTAETASGGGIYNQHDTGGSITGCTFTGNDGDLTGGGLVIHADSDLLVTGCHFEGNSAAGGGGLFLSAFDGTIRDCTFRENSAGGGGGGACFALFGTSEFVNCLFDRNAAVGGGGGMHTQNDQSVLINCTFTGNDGGGGGGGAMLVQSGSMPLLYNCILWNDVPEEVSYSYPTALPLFAFCDVQGSGGSDAWLLEPALDLGGNIDADPLFVDGDGIDDDDHTLQYGSPAIDAADSDAVPPGVTTDLAGKPRFKDDPDTVDTGVPNGEGIVVDMGGYEYQPPCFGDINENGAVDFGDILAIIGAWGSCSGCPEDLDGDDVVGFGDILAVIGNWGPC